MPWQQLHGSGRGFGCNDFVSHNQVFFLKFKKASLTALKTKIQKLFFMTISPLSARGMRLLTPFDLEIKTD
jgi:hypothetical protein